MSVVVVVPTRRGNSSAKRSLCLPIIAPKEDTLIDSHTPGIISPITLSRLRVRLPPRSRTGCWTCRSRKVKCDEGHPQCDQCTRLGHVCDYQPRLSFKDDTRRTMKRMAGIQTEGNIVWDPKLRSRSQSSSPISSTDSTLPPFSLLTSDEEREKRAESSIPGTYHVVVVPDSFADLPEYTQSERNTRASAVSSDTLSDYESPTETTDPNVVILKTFQDTTRRVSAGRSSTLSPVSDMLGSLSPVEPCFASQVAMEDNNSYFPNRTIDQTSQKKALIRHFREVVWKQLNPGVSSLENLDDSNLNAETFEEKAAEFPPLSLAIMAVSALSLAQQDGARNLDAMQYYQQAFPSLQNSLRSSEDLLSDGLFLTHFLLLIYEIAAAEPRGSNLWSHHISRLLHISLLRQSAAGRERYPFIIWWVCNIDLYALFSGSGTGEFVKTMMEHHLLPGPESLLYPAGSQGYSLIYPEESDNLPLLLRLYRDTFMLAVRLGLLAAEIRKMKKSSPMLSLSDQQQRELLGLREAFRGLWESPEITLLIQQQTNLPQRSKDILQQTCTLFHTSLLFSYTSMWPQQRLGTEAVSEEDLHHHVAAVLHIAESSIPSGGCGRPLITFPLFLAGTATNSHELKMIVMELLSKTAGKEMGYNAATTQRILQVVYERQTQRLMSVGHILDVDWVDLLDQHDLQMVHFG